MQRMAPKRTPNTVWSEDTLGVMLMDVVLGVRAGAACLLCFLWYGGRVCKRVGRLHQAQAKCEAEQGCRGWVSVKGVQLGLCCAPEA